MALGIQGTSKPTRRYVHTNQRLQFNLNNQKITIVLERGCKLILKYISNSEASFSLHNPCLLPSSIMKFNQGSEWGEENKPFLSPSPLSLSSTSERDLISNLINRECRRKDGRPHQRMEKQGKNSVQITRLQRDFRSFCYACCLGHIFYCFDVWFHVSDCDGGTNYLYYSKVN